ncbi:MAG: hypothetical protein KGR69_15185 [Verrucomicrobia bacterium]|jgi:hypothetical protein|nr:hypothetical protein [Verrucomicrobiota bacterium]
MKPSSKRLVTALLPVVIGFIILPARSEVLRANGVITGNIFNTATRQHIQASFSGSGTLQPSGDNGRANGRVASVIGNRAPRPTLAGPYRVQMQAHVTYDGGSTSITRIGTVTVYRNEVVIPGIGRIQLDRPLNLTRPGRQAFRADVRLVFPVS